MLDAFIIDEIRRRKEERDLEGDLHRPRAELPVPERPTRQSDDDEPPGGDPDGDRGVVIIDYSVPTAVAVRG